MVGIHIVIWSHLRLSFNTSSTTGTTESKTLGNQHETPPWRVPWKHSFTKQIIPQFQWATCCLRPRGQVEKWQKVYHKGSHELTGKKNKHAVRRAWNRCCATGYIKWPEITQTQRNQSENAGLMWERYIEDAQQRQTMSLKDHSDIFLGSQMIILPLRLLNLSSTDQGSQSKSCVWKACWEVCFPRRVNRTVVTEMWN